MGKPRIIIADADVNYILPLQLKFAEEFLDEIDLEIISDPSYQTAIDDIEGAVGDAEDAVDTLRTSSWKSGASDAFFENFDSNWKKNIENRIQIIKHLKGCLEEAKKEYDAVYTEATQLGNSL